MDRDTGMSSDDQAEPDGSDLEVLNEHLAERGVRFLPFDRPRGEVQEAVWRRGPDGRGRCVRINWARARALGLEHPDEAIGLTVAELNGRPSTPEMENLAQSVRARQRGNAGTITWYVNRRTGQQHWLWMLSLAEVGPSGEELLHTYAWPMLPPPDGEATHGAGIIEELHALREAQEAMRRELTARQAMGDPSAIWELVGMVKWFMARQERLEAEQRSRQPEREQVVPLEDTSAHRHVAKLGYPAWAEYAGLRDHLREIEAQLVGRKPPREPTWEAVTGLLSVGPRQVIRHMEDWGLRPPKKREKNPDWPPSKFPEEPRRVPQKKIDPNTLGHLGGLAAAMLPIAFDLLYDTRVDHAMRFCRAIAENMIHTGKHP